jgi:hypothetical protein
MLTEWGPAILICAVFYGALLYGTRRRPDDLERSLNRRVDDLDRKLSRRMDDLERDLKRHY